MRESPQKKLAHTRLDLDRFRNVPISMRPMGERTNKKPENYDQKLNPIVRDLHRLSTMLTDGRLTFVGFYEFVNNRNVFATCEKDHSLFFKS